MKKRSSSIHNQPTLTGALLRSLLLHNAHLGGNLDTTERTVIGAVTGLNIDRIYIKVLILVLAKQLSMTCYGASSREVCYCGFVGSMSIGATSRQKPGEDPADYGSQEWEAGAHDGDVAFRGCPVGGCDVAICIVD